MKERHDNRDDVIERLRREMQPGEWCVEKAGKTYLVAPYEERVVCYEPDSVDKFLSANGFEEPLRQGKVRCYICGRVVTRQTLFSFSKYHTFWTLNFFQRERLRASCNDSDCIMKALPHMQKRQ